MIHFGAYCLWNVDRTDSVSEWRRKVIAAGYGKGLFIFMVAFTRRTFAKTASALVAAWPFRATHAVAVPRVSDDAQQRVIRYLENLAKPGGGYGWAEQPDVYLPMRFPVSAADFATLELDFRKQPIQTAYFHPSRSARPAAPCA